MSNRFFVVIENEFNDDKTRPLIGRIVEEVPEFSDEEEGMISAVTNDGIWCDFVTDELIEVKYEGEARILSDEEASELLDRISSGDASPLLWGDGNNNNN